MYKFIIFIMIVALVFLGISIIGDNTSYQGSIISPEQRNIFPSEKEVYEGNAGDVDIFLKAEYDIRGVVKGKKKYSDYSSQVSKYDIILVWGDLNKKEYDQHISYSQSGRWYYYTYDQEMIEGNFIAKQSANIHLIPENEDIADKINKVRKNDYIRIKGHLVDVDFSDGIWETSMTRGDTGNGACEILFVKELHIVD